MCDFEAVNIEISLQEDKYKISVSCFGDRLKNMRILPE